MDSGFIQIVIGVLVMAGSFIAYLTKMNSRVTVVEVKVKSIEDKEEQVRKDISSILVALARIEEKLEHLRDK